MSKFKKGDKVKVREWDDLAKQYGLDGGGNINTHCGFLKEMREYCGKTLIVEYVGGRYVNLKKTKGWNFDLDVVRPVDETSEFKFKVGDKVIGNKKADKHYGVTCQGWVGIVTSVYKTYFEAKDIDGGYDDTEFDLRYDCFDLYSDCDRKVVIRTDGKKTIAELYEGGKVVKTKIAKCNDEDEFDFETGAKIAFDRLLERVTGDTPYLTCNEIHNSPSYGVIGTPTNYKDVLGRSLCVGDTVDIFTSSGDCVDETCVVETKTDGQFIMGIACDCDAKKGTTGNWKVLKKRSYKDVEDGESVGMIDYKK